MTSARLIRTDVSRPDRMVIRATRRRSPLVQVARFALTAVALAVGCHPSNEPTNLQTAPTTAPPKATPADHLGPDELLEGTIDAFGVVLPRSLHVDGRFHDVVYASGPLSLHPLVTYLRARLEGGDLREGPTTATFDHVRALAKRGPDLRIHVEAALNAVHLEVHDETQPSLPAFPDEAARWRHVGLTPDGRLADPTHLD
ncbi:MAG: hypothetical protein ABSC94_02000 [Polyangiaceae bacterium]|jgi:hypothetical protein